MTRTDVTAVYRTSSLEDYPEFEAKYYVDDHGSPTTVTICSCASTDQIAAEWIPSEVSTEWISCDVGHAVPMEAIR